MVRVSTYVRRCAGAIAFRNRYNLNSSDASAQLCARLRWEISRQSGEPLPSAHLAKVEGVEGEVSRLTVLLVHVDDGREKDDFRQADPKEELPHGALVHL